MEMDRGQFLKFSAFWFGAGVLWLAGGCATEVSLLEFEKRYKNKLLDPKEYSLRKDWIFHIARTLVSETGFGGKLEDLAGNFSFAYSQKEYEDLFKNLPGSEEDVKTVLSGSNAATTFNDDGPTGTVVFLERIKGISMGMGFDADRVVGITIAHEMGHRALGKPRDLNNPFRLPGTNAVMLVTKTQGLKLRGFDENNPNRPLHYLELLEEVPAELQAKLTYRDGYVTPGSPLRDAATLLPRVEKLFGMLQIPINEVISYQRASDPLGLMDRIALRVNASEDYNLRVIFGINLIQRALLDNFGEVTKFLDKPSSFIFQSVTPPQ